ncbi:complement C3-like [Stegostoma tigrinum]|uniref:complement C3-like n=1 Tax=Stegostoma tigrinum TaxID=3053191 RepID=UPI00202AF1B1|nr:complement C3-like [Stegostoma tigrinum]
MELLRILFSACLFLPFAEQKPSYLITAPNVVHIGMDETITVQVFQGPPSAAITVYFEGQAGESPEVLLSQKHKVELNQENNFTKVIHMQVLPEKTKHLNITHQTQYAVLVAEVPFDVTRKTRVQLAPSLYFIYVVTDKPIYKPDETVRYQIFTLDEEMNPIDTMVLIEVSDSKGNILASANEQDGSNSVHSGEISIQSEMLGRYQIRATVSGNSKSEGVTSFQVQNYELLYFDMRIIPDRWYYVVTDSFFPVTVQVQAKSTCDLHGSVTFGITISGQRVPLSKVQPIHCTLNKDFRVTLDTNVLIKNINENGGMDKFKKGTLYIQADISDQKGHHETKLVDNIPFRTSPYHISLAGTKPYFTPGTDFYSLISVIYPNGSAAVTVPINVLVNITGENILTSEAVGQTDQLGELGFTFMAPWNAETIEIVAIAGNGDTGFERMRKIVKKHHSASKRYLHIGVPHVLLYPGDTITVNLTAVSQHDLRNVRYFNYMVLGKRKVLDFRRVERGPETTFDVRITQEMIPFFRIVAYYVVNDTGKEEIVADSQRIEVESLCDTKFQVDSALLHQWEDYELELSVMSDNPTEVFVRAVDPRLKELYAQDTITMRKVFEDLNSYDIGTFYGSGKDTLGVFNHSRLHPLSNLLPELLEPAVHEHPKEPSPKGILKKMLDPVPEDGMSSLKPDKRPASSQEIPALRVPLVDGSGERTVTIRQKKHKVHRAAVHDNLIHPIFNGSSMWMLNTRPGNNNFRLISDLLPPRSWEIHVLGLSEENGLCLAKEELLILDQGHSQPAISTTPLTAGSAAGPVKRNSE